MTQDHPNVALLKRLDLRNLAASRDLIAEDVVWHYANPNLPDLQGDYVGLDGVRSFFEAVGQRSKGTFEIHPKSVTPVGDELVVVHSQNTLTFEGRKVAVEVVVVWRFVDGRVVEVWDIVPGDAKEIGND
ncbi:MAG: nuclear transport factor 2 family protein [Paracoccaceae bacterium]|nr:nuclear transport factor 2 family protein [Paracoccaceae bacterium]